MWDFDWLCYMRLLGDCRSFLQRPSTSEVVSTRNDHHLKRNPNSHRDSLVSAADEVERPQPNSPNTHRLEITELTTEMEPITMTPTAKTAASAKQQSSSSSSLLNHNFDSFKSVLADISQHLKFGQCKDQPEAAQQNSKPVSGGEHEGPMDSDEFRRRGKEMVDYICDYLDTIHTRRVTPNIEPGYLKGLLPDSAPMKSQSWDEVMGDFEKFIMPGMTHWQHPRFHAYFPAGNSYPSILADMISDGIGCVGFSWAASPVCTELEIIMLDWVGKMIGLPKEFLCYADQDSNGGGVIQGSASDCILVSLLAARCAAIKELKLKYPNADEGTLLSKLVGYCSKEAHSAVEKAAMIALVKLRILDTDENFSLRGEPLRKAMQDDREAGLVPFFVSATLGTTSCCSFDCLEEIGKVADNEGVWLHVDAAYAGNAFICPEYQFLMKGIEYASSFNTNPNKWMLVNFDCSLLWVKDRIQLTQALVVDPLYLQHSYSERAIDYRHWGIPLSRRFRSLKLWFVIRNYGVEGLQQYIREHVRLAKLFEKLIRQDERFEVVNQVKLGLVCFRLKGNDVLNQRLLSSINASGKLHMVPASLNGHYVIRFCVCAQNASNADIDHAFRVIGQFASDLFEILDIEKRSVVASEQPENVATTNPVEDNEAADEVFMLDRKRQMSLRMKRSFFVRMVSDPKLYNPKIVKSLNTSTSSLEDKERHRSEDSTNTPVKVVRNKQQAAINDAQQQKMLTTGRKNDETKNN